MKNGKNVLGLVIGLAVLGVTVYVVSRAFFAGKQQAGTTMK